MTNTIYIHQPEKAFSFTRLPNFLFEAPTFKPLSNEAKVLYAFILRRTELSRKNGWADDCGRIYLYYPICEVVDLLHCGWQKAVNTLRELQYWSVLAQQDGDKLLKRLLNASDKERNTARKRQTAELKKAEKRKAEVDTLFAKMYEDWSAGRITEYNFNMLSEKYQGEQRELDAKIERLHEAMEVAAQTAVDAEKWIGLMKQYVNPTELTAELLNTLIEKILVHEAVKSEDGSREQEVEIFYRFIGKIE